MANTAATMSGGSFPPGASSCDLDTIVQYSVTRSHVVCATQRGKNAHLKKVCCQVREVADAEAPVCIMLECCGELDID